MQPTQIICKNCAHVFTGDFCNQCGEKVYTAHDKTIKHLFEEGFHFITHFEGKFFTTVKTMFAHPGKFSFDYCGGLRKKYFKPLSFFLLVVVLYLVFPLAKGLNQNLGSYLGGEWYSSFALNKTRHLIALHHWTDEQTIERFHITSEKVSKFLLFIFIPFLALLSWLLTYKKRKLFFDHFIFSTEINSFMILWGFFVLPFLMALLYNVIHLLKISFAVPDYIYGIIVALVVGIYVFRASRLFYSFKTGYALLFTILYVAFLMMFMKFVYKFILFFITINLIH